MQPSGIPVVFSNSERLLLNCLQPDLSFRTELQRRQSEVKEWRKRNEKFFVTLELPSKKCLKIHSSSSDLIEYILKKGVSFLIHGDPSSTILSQYYVSIDGPSQDILSTEKSLEHYNINSKTKLLCRFREAI